MLMNRYSPRILHILLFRTHTLFPFQVTDLNSIAFLSFEYHGFIQSMRVSHREPHRSQQQISKITRVVLKFIADPHSHSLPHILVHFSTCCISVHRVAWSLVSDGHSSHPSSTLLSSRQPTCFILLFIIPFLRFSRNIHNSHSSLFLSLSMIHIALF